MSNHRSFTLKIKSAGTAVEGMQRERAALVQHLDKGMHAFFSQHNKSEAVAAALRAQVSNSTPP
jgi:hypothetical protein